MNRRSAARAGVGFGLVATIVIMGFGVGNGHFPWFQARSPATGEVGILYVHGQTEDGPVRLRPGVRWVLKRPQRLAFDFDVKGTGERSVHIELDDGTKRWLMHMQRIEAPKEHWYLKYLMDLDRNVPDNITVIVRVDAPHAMSVQSVFPIRLLPSSPRKLLPTPKSSHSK